MSKQALDQSLAHWEKLMSAAKASGLPLMEALRRQLAAQVQSIRMLVERRLEVRAEMRKSTRELRSYQAQARTLASRIQFLARAAILDRGSLSEFGIKPRAKRRLKAILDRKEDEAPRNPTTA